MMRNKPLTSIVLLSILMLAGCGKTQRMHQEAYDLSEVGNYNKALEIYEELMKEKPNDPTILNDYGWTLFMSDSLQPALEMLKKAKNASGEGPSLLKKNIKKNITIVEAFIEAKNYLEQGHPGKARDIYDDLNKSWKARDMRLKYYALAYESLGHQKKAKEYWQQIIDKYAQADFDSHFYNLATRKVKLD